MQLSDEEIRRVSLGFLIGNPFYAVALVVAFISPVAVLIINGAVALYYMVAGMRSPELEMTKTTFYYDFSSPYSYLAAERISGLFAEAGVEQPEWQPISFGHVLKTTGRRPWSFEEDPTPTISPRSIAAQTSAACPRSSTRGAGRSRTTASTRPGPPSTQRSRVAWCPSPSPAFARCSPAAGT